jgi:hypothetical protein
MFNEFDRVFNEFGEESTRCLIKHLVKLVPEIGQFPVLIISKNYQISDYIKYSFLDEIKLKYNTKFINKDLVLVDNEAKFLFTSNNNFSHKISGFDFSYIFKDNSLQDFK